MPTKIWRSDESGKLYHDECFEEGETRVGFTLVAIEGIEDIEDEECESCGGDFLTDFDEDDDEDDE